MGTHLFQGARVRPSWVRRTRQRGILCSDPSHVRTDSRMAGATWLFFSLACSTSSNAQLAPPYGELIRQAEISAPRLAEAQANVRAAQGRADQAAVLPNPSAVFTTENLGSKTSNGFSAEQHTLSLSQPIELGGKRSARIFAGMAEVNATQAQNRQLTVDFINEIALAYVGAEAAQSRVALYLEAIDAADQDSRAAQALVNAGREPQLRTVQARSGLSATQADLQAARAESAAALGHLSTLAGVGQTYAGVIPILLPQADGVSLSPPQTPTDFPSVLAAQAARQAAAQRVNVERTRSSPTVTASLGVRRIAGESGTLFVGGLTVPLPLFDHNRGNIDAALAELDAADARLRGARAEAETGWRSALAQSVAAEGRLAAAREAESTANQAYELTRTAYEAGRTPLIDLLTARRNLTDAQLRLIDSRVARIRAEAALARLSGRIPFGDNP
jgi:cobalt-zinc-cadmium efflux system outer membrane protein